MIYTHTCVCIYIYIYTYQEESISSICISAASPAGLRTCSWSWGLPTLGCLCKALPNMEQVLRPTGVWQKRTLELIVFSDIYACMFVYTCICSCTCACMYTFTCLEMELGALVEGPVDWALCLGLIVRHVESLVVPRGSGKVEERMGKRSTVQKNRTKTSQHMVCD